MLDIWRLPCLLLIYSASTNCVSGQADYLGCYVSVDHDLSASSPTNSLTVNQCITYCGTKRYVYAALAHLKPFYYRPYNANCICTSSIEGASTIKDDTCRVRCPGDSTQICGGYGSYSVYNIAPTTTTLTTTTIASTTTPTTTIPVTTYVHTSKPLTTVEEVDVLTTGFRDVTIQSTEFTKEISTGRHVDVSQTSENPYISTFSKGSQEDSDWYIYGGIMLVFISTAIFVAAIIRHKRRKAAGADADVLTLSAFQNRNLNPTDNLYLVGGDSNYSEVSETVLTDGRENENYEDVPDFLGGGDGGGDQRRDIAPNVGGQSDPLPDVLYHSVHRPESSSAENDDGAMCSENMTRSGTSRQEDSRQSKKSALYHSVHRPESCSAENDDALYSENMTRSGTSRQEDNRRSKKSAQRNSSYRASLSSSIDSRSDGLYESITSQIFHNMLSKATIQESPPSSASTEDKFLYESVKSQTFHDMLTSSKTTVYESPPSSASTKDKFLYDSINSQTLHGNPTSTGKGSSTGACHYQRGSSSRASHSSSVGSVDNSIYESTASHDRSAAKCTDHKTPRVCYQTVHRPESSSSSCDDGGLRLTDYSNRRREYPLHPIRPSHSSSVGSVDNIIYESRDTLVGGIEEEVFSPSPSIVSYEGTVLNCIYEATDT